jgi:hypothetical protein
MVCVPTGRHAETAARTTARWKTLLLAAATAAGLAACDGHRATGVATTTGVKGFCTPFVTAQTPPQNATPASPMTPAPAAGDASAATDDCLHRWGYSLAASADPADLVARATVAACASHLVRWNQQSLVDGQDSSSGGGEAPSLMTGQLTTPIAEHNEYAQARALFYVVQARAGKCAAPAVVNGTPGGVVDRF